MLTNDIKKKIDTARDILVGKVPDPKAQVEQITTAMIYKFMDDMDRISEGLGGKTSFFTNGYEKYAWHKLIDRALEGEKRVKLYSEAMEKLPDNPDIPELFRDILKGAILPYRSAETLNLFLKEMNGFSYDHSENLGDAFEYLLSILGSQGDAGQFRTPRHLIDFIVEIVDPKKQDRICDPACGTAGFLISAYKHIKLHNSSNFDPETYQPSFARHFSHIAAVEIQPDGMYQGDRLTNDDKAKFEERLVGYDISPDMVRISKVNMYLHKFQNPVIYEYDALSSQEKWNEKFDVILANPPFMTPKGGITPHKHFSIDANRAEVLFVDYIISHLRHTGRAGIIVPEGIIFDAKKAYIKLRKLLLEKGLFAVISLPSGVFKPYSGVKTSILLIDKTLVANTNNLLFIKVANDGYDLGDQRRPINKNDLPQAFKLIKSYKAALQNNQPPLLTDEDKSLAHIVSKETIIASGEYNLSGDRYKETAAYMHQKWPMVNIDTIGKVVSGFGFPLQEQGKVNELIPFYKVSDMNSVNNQMYMNKSIHTISEYTAATMKIKTFSPDTVIFPKIGAAIATNKKRILTKTSTFDNNVMGIIPDKNQINPLYLYWVLSNINLSNWASSSHPPSIRKTTVEKHKIPFPPLNIQQQIVEQIETKQQAIDHAKALIQIIEKERSNLDYPLKKLNCEWIELKDVLLCAKSGFACGKSEKAFGEILHLRPMNITINGELSLKDSKYITKEFSKNKKGYFIKVGDVLFNNTNSKELVGKTCYVNQDMVAMYSNHITRIRVNEKYNSKFLALVLNNLHHQGLFLELCNKWVGQAGIGLNTLSKIKIPFPSLDIQTQLVAEIEKDKQVIAENKALIVRYEQKIKDILNEL